MDITPLVIAILGVFIALLVAWSKPIRSNAREFVETYELGELARVAVEYAEKQFVAYGGEEKLAEAVSVFDSYLQARGIELDEAVIVAFIEKAHSDMSKADADE